MAKLRISPKVLSFILVCVLINVIVLAQLFYDGWRLGFARKPNVPENVLIEPSPLPENVLKKLSLGLNNFVSDLLWIQTIQYYGGGDPSGKYRKLSKMFELVTSIDPKFSYPYVMGLLVLPGEGFAKEAQELGRKGMANPALKDNWEIPYYLGMVEHFNLKNTAEAAKLFELASKSPEAPAMTKLMAGIYYAKSNQRETAYNLYYVVHETTKNEYVKERARKYLDHMELIFGLEKAAGLYKQTYGSFPSDLSELVTKKIITNLPADPLGRDLRIDPETGIVSEVSS